MRTTDRKGLTAAGAAAAALITSLYYLLFFNRFVGLRSGDGEFWGGDAMIHGSVPFRDYFTASPPLNQFKAALLLEIFGDKLIVLRFAGMIERGLIALVIYLWLMRLRVCRPAQAVAACIVTLILASADTPDPLASYSHDAIFGAILSGYFLSFVLDRSRLPRAQVWFAAAAGFVASLSFLSKQTTGLGALTIVPLVSTAIMWRKYGFRPASRAAGGFLVGAATPLLVFLGWLASLGAVRKFFLANFVEGPAAKAQDGGGDFFKRFVLVMHNNLSARADLKIAIALALLGALFFRGLRRSTDEPGHRSDLTEMIAVAVGGLGVLGLGVWESFHYSGEAHRGWPFNCVFIMVPLLLGLLAFYSPGLFHKTLDDRRAQLMVFAVTSLTCAFMVSLSYPLLSVMLLPGFALVYACALAGSARWGQIALYAAAIICCADAVRHKLEIPYGFWSFKDGAVSTATARSRQPKLAGMRLPAPTVQFIDEVAACVAATTTTADTIFTYPEMGIFYPLTERGHPTESGSHNVDVVTDSFAKAEAARLLAHPPKVVIYAPETEEEFSSQENQWRHGRRMGQRDIAAALDRLATQYRLIAVTPRLGTKQEIRLYVDPASSSNCNTIAPKPSHVY